MTVVVDPPLTPPAGVSVNATHNCRTSLQLGTREDQTSQSSLSGSSADADGSTPVQPEGTSSSEQGAADPDVSPPRAQPGGRPNTGKTRAGERGATKPGGSRNKGGTSRQHGAQKS